MQERTRRPPERVPGAQAGLAHQCRMHPTHQRSRRVRKVERAPRTRKRPIPRPTRAWEPEQQEPAQREPEELGLPVRELERAPRTRKRPIPRPTRAREPEQQEPAQREPEELELEQAPQTRKRPIPRPTRAPEPAEQQLQLRQRDHRWAAVVAGAVAPAASATLAERQVLSPAPWAAKRTRRVQTGRRSRARGWPPARARAASSVRGDRTLRSDARRGLVFVLVLGRGAQRRLRTSSRGTPAG